MTSSRSPRRSSIWKRIPRGGRSLISLAVFVAVLLSARASLADHYRVPSGSMRPSVEVGDRLLVDKSAYGLRVPLTNTYLKEWDHPRRGDVVVVESPQDGTVLLKRVVAIPGDRVAVRSGLLSLNGAAVKITAGPEGPLEHLGNRPHRIRLDGPPGPDYGPTLVPPRRYLLLGDNRGDSHDGRYFGLVKRDFILGKAVRVYYRQGRFTWIRL